MSVSSAPPDRHEDRPLHDDVRFLASTLGRVIRKMEGEDCFRAVEQLRTGCRSRRFGETGAPDLNELLAVADALPLHVAGKVARAFALFFQLINAAEQVHRARGPGPGGTAGRRRSVARALEQLRAGGMGWEAAAALLRELEVRPVLTAHPTEATRGTALALTARVAEHLFARDGASPAERTAAEEALEYEVELLWLTSEVREERPSVLDEVVSALWYLEHRLLGASARVVRRLSDGFREVFGREPGILCPLSLGSWVGGDRDGNPFVTPEVTLQAARRAARAVLEAYLRSVEGLVQRLSLSTRVKPVSGALLRSLERDREELPQVWEAYGKEHANEPLRLKLSYAAARLRARRAALLGRPGPQRGAYSDARGLEADLRLVRDALSEAGAGRAPQALLDPLLAQVQAHGFHGFRLDVRQEASRHTEAVAALSEAVGLPPLDRAALRRELLGRRPLWGERVGLGEEPRETLEVFRAMRRVQEEIGRLACSTYVISMTHAPEDLLRVLLLAREAGLVDLAADPPVSNLDVVPLFETGEDLERAPQVMASLFSDPAYRRHLDARGRRQEVMIGYSDSGKDVGILPASWLLYCAQEELAKTCRGAGVSLTLFHGRGGTVGRGGGSPVLRALQALPPGTVEGKIKITEQGEVIAQKFALLPIAEDTLEVMVAGTLLATADAAGGPAAEDELRFRQVIDRLAELALPVYRRLVHEDDRLFRLFLEATPVRALAQVHFGSRPAYRQRGPETMENLRAIPWVFGWTQIRLNVPSWLGVGTALSTVADEPEGLETLRRMVRTWPYFDDLLGKVEMVCAKTDPRIARLYVERLKPEGLSLLDELDREYERTVGAICRIRDADHLLAAQPLLRTTIGHRDPYLDPLSLLQVSLLTKKRASAEAGPESEELDRALGTTLNGVAQGLRNTG